MSRPEHIAPADVYYSSTEAGKYTGNSRVQTIQREMAERCIELLNFPEGARRLVLDVGCGSGLSGDALVDAGHEWVGLDVSEPMLKIAVESGAGPGGDGGDVVLGDMGQGFGVRAGIFDGAISVSALQWLCYSDKSDHRAGKRLSAFFSSLYCALRRGARAALQFYPESVAQIELITAAAHRCGFTGGLVVDNPESTKAKKYYLCIFSGSDAAVGVREPGDSLIEESSGLDGMEDDEDDDEDEDDEDEEVEEGGIAKSVGADGLTVGAASRRTGGAGTRVTKGTAVGGGGGGGGDGRVPFESRRGEADGAARAEKAARRRARAAQRPLKSKSRLWVLAKKDASRRRGREEVRPDTKYTGRKRGPKF